MPIPTQVSQSPQPGEHLLCFRGDTFVFHLQLDKQRAGKAFVRTNLGHAGITRHEIIRQVEFNEARQGRDWFDIPMTLSAPGQFEAVINLDEVGHFEAKCLFIPKGQQEPWWPVGPNTAVNVEPADTVCGNIVYNAFVRQFGTQKHQAQIDYGQAADLAQRLDQTGFTVIPPSGTFRDLIAQLDFVMCRLGCRMIQLLPIHPTPTTYARMGRFGSPYAALSFTAVDPALAVFDPKATPLDQFLELVDAVHARHGKVILDIAINHTGWAASLHESHPQWLVRKKNGEIENPSAWGVVWADLTRLDFSRKDLWCYMADVFLTWCRRGVDGFRCDAGYMIPQAAWQYMIAKVREQFSDALFLLEGLGGKIEVTRDLLNRANFNWAYSELFQNYNRQQIEAYLPEALEISAGEGITIHFAETHDNNRLAATSHLYARMRTALCALAAPYGTFGFANGVEWFATEKINVHQACALNWDNPVNQVAQIARLSHILKTHPCFSHPVEIFLVAHGQGNFLALARYHRPSKRRLVILVNLDVEQGTPARWDSAKAGLSACTMVDLLSGRQVTVDQGALASQVNLEPGEVLCLAAVDDLWLQEMELGPAQIPLAVTRQELKAKAMEAMAHLPGNAIADMDQAADSLKRDPEQICSQLDAAGQPPRVIFWHFPQDLQRQVMVPPRHFLLLRADHPFHIRLSREGFVIANEKSLPDDSGRSFALLAPLTPPRSHCLYDLDITCYTPQGTRHGHSVVLALGEGRQMKVRSSFSRNDCHHLPLLALGTDGRGAMMRVAADWGRLDNRYDAILAANVNPDFPEDRRIMLTRCRAWVVYQGFSQEVSLDCLEEFAFDYRNGAAWRFQMITGQGEHIMLRIGIRMADDMANTVHLHVQRMPARAGHAELADKHPATLILRPDIENRNFHHSTKAYTGPEDQWPAAISTMEKGFAFNPPGGAQLLMVANQGQFSIAPEWYYMVHHALEAERGQDPDSDLFSPGYFSIPLKGGEHFSLTAQVTAGSESRPPVPSPTDWPWPAAELPLESALSAALNQFVVKRGFFNTVIAGFPWFLDWGRDTLIVVRGLISDGRLDLAASILIQFACFEKNGTLPNMIRGNDAGNRDTSDAPLWFFKACSDLVEARGDEADLNADCGGRTLRQVLVSIALAFIEGTANGIIMDQDSGLIFSPAHFTWMDTNYPAGTPRQGYPIEIQALWYAALSFLTRIDASDIDRWASLARQVKISIDTLFRLPDQAYLCDCRHGQPGQSAAQAWPDDALRPNQLLAITLGAVDDDDTCQGVLKACQQLLVPGAIRSLADQPVKVPLAVYNNNRLLNDPQKPYWGRYLGDEDTRRKPAYHNGTAWTWLFPSYCEAWATIYGDAGKSTALAWLSSSIGLINWHCVGQVPEIVDGDAPHHQRGCDAQAWGVSELLRVWKKIG